MTDPTAPPVLSPLLTMTEAQYAHDHSDAKDDLLTVLHRLIRAHRELDAQRALVAAHEQERAQYEERLIDVATQEYQQRKRAEQAEAEVARLTQENEMLRAGYVGEGTGDAEMRAEAAEQETARLKAALLDIGNLAGAAVMMVSRSPMDDMRDVCDMVHAALTSPDAEKP